jgi:hypothetical protein
MNRALKATLLSGLVFPGLGQIALKHYKRGLALLLSAMLGLGILVVEAYQQAMAILSKIDMEGGVPDMPSLAKAAAQSGTASGTGLYHLAWTLIIGAWVIGVVDAFRLGRRLEKEVPGTAP